MASGGAELARVGSEVTSSATAARAGLALGPITLDQMFA